MINKSFTLIEVIIAIFILTMGTVGAFSLIQRTIAFTSISSSRLTAAYLAQEGMEIARNIRDSNYLFLKSKGKKYLRKIWGHRNNSVGLAL